MASSSCTIAVSYTHLFYGLEIQRESAEMAARSVKLNGLEDKIEIIHGDIKDAGSIFKPSSIDVITTNPPYMNSGGGDVYKRQVLK